MDIKKTDSNRSKFEKSDMNRPEWIRIDSYKHKYPK